MKSWADHCSSDEESDDEHHHRHHHHRHHRKPSEPKIEVEDHVEEQESHEQQAPAPPVKKKKEHVLPDGPPFTAFVGNLAFSIKHPDDLGTQISNLVKERFQKEIHVVSARIATDRNTGLQRGFGYVEVETLEQLQAVLELDDGESLIDGRDIHLDVAQQPPNRSDRSRSSGSRGGDLDGSSFRGGRYNKQDGGRNRGSGRGRQNDSTKSTESSGPPPQRTSLKLKPRSQPVDVGGDSSSSDIFGGAKARDASEWERRQSVKKEEEATAKKEEKGPSKGKGGRGGSGHGGGERDSGRGGKGGRGNNKRQPKEQEKKEAPPVRKPAPEPEKSESSSSIKAVTNPFSALGFEDSDSD